MALETVTVMLDKSWTLLSAAAAGSFRADVVGGRVLFAQSATPPDATTAIQRDVKLVVAAVTAKIWARATDTSGTALVKCVRTVDAGNAAELMLPAAALSAMTFSTTLAAGAEIATIDPGLAGATVERIIPNDGRVLLNSDGTKLIRGLSTVGVAAPDSGEIEITIVTRHPFINGVRRTKIVLTVNGADVLGPMTFAQFMTGARYLVNMTGLEFAGDVMPGTCDSQVRRQPLSTWQMLQTLGIPGVRLVGLMERMQPDLFGPLGSTLPLLSSAPEYQAGVKTTVDYLDVIEEQFKFGDQTGRKIQFAPAHNYGSRALKKNGAWDFSGGAGRYGRYQVGSADVSIAAFADYWRQVALLFRPGGRLFKYRHVLIGFDLMNEWTAMPSMTNPVSGVDGPSRTVAVATQAAIDAIRSTGYKGLIFAEGWAYSSLSDWKIHNPPGTLDTVTDPEGNIVWSGHDYNDAGHSGTYPNSEQTKPNYGVLLTSGAAALTGPNSLKTWWDELPAAKKANSKGYQIGETNSPNTPEWQELERLKSIAARNAGYSIAAFGLWPNSVANQPYPDDSANRVINLMPQPFATGPTKRMLTTLAKLHAGDATVENPIGLGQLIIPALSGSAGGAAQMDNGSGGKSSAVVTNRTIGAAISIALKNGATTVGALGVNASTGVITGTLPAAGTYDLEVTQTLGLLTYTQTFSAGIAVSGIYMPASIMVDRFESLSDTAGTARAAQGNGQNGGVVALSLDTAKKVEGASGILVAQTTAANATIGVNTANAGSHDPASFDVVAFYADVSDRALVSNHALNITRNGQTVSISQSDIAYPGGDWIVGDMSLHSNYATFAAGGAGTLLHSPRLSQNSPYGAAFTVDAFIKSAKGVAIYVFRYDDISQSQFDGAFQLHKKWNLPMSVNVPVDFIGQGGRWSQAMIDEGYASGLVEYNCDSTRADTAANITDSDADRAAALASLMANHDYLVSKGFTRNEGHKHLIWANGVHSNKLAQHFQDNGFRFMVSTLPGQNYIKHGVGRGRAKIMLSTPSVGTETYEGNWKAGMDRAESLGLLHIQHCHGTSDSGNDTRLAQLDLKMQRVRASVDAGKALCLGLGAAWNFAGGFTTALTL